MSPRPLWFGRVLSWSVDGDYRTARYNGHDYAVEKLSRRQADDINRGPAGWYLTAFPDEVRRGVLDAPIGPCVGSRLDGALMVAEAWILAGTTACQNGPTLTTALCDMGPGFSWGKSASTLVIYPNHARAELEIRTVSDYNAPRSGKLVGTIGVTFTPAAPSAQVLGFADSSARITWRPTLADGTALGELDSWHEACAAVSNA